MTTPFELLLSAIRDAVRYAAGSPATDCPETAILDDLLNRPFPPGESSVEPAQPPVVTDYLDAAIESATTSRQRTLARAVAVASPHLRWIAPYQPGDGADELAEGYASAMLSMPGPPLRAGYQAPYANPDVIVAFTLQAPDTFYPLHRHKAPEIYHVISGTAQWQRDGEPWRRRLPGEWFFHASDQGHAMRTASEPLLAVVAWIDHLDCPPPVLEVGGAD